MELGIHEQEQNQRRFLTLADRAGDGLVLWGRERTTPRARASMAHGVSTHPQPLLSNETGKGEGMNETKALMQGTKQGPGEKKQAWRCLCATAHFLFCRMGEKAFGSRTL